MSQMEKYRDGCSQQMEWLMTKTMTVWLVASFQCVVHNQTARMIHQRPHLCYTKTPLLQHTKWSIVEQPVLRQLLLPERTSLAQVDVSDGEVQGRLQSADGMVNDKDEDCVAGRLVSVRGPHSNSSNDTSEITPLLNQDASTTAHVCDGEVPGRLPSTDGFIFGRSDDCVAGRIISDQYVGAAFCGVLTKRICRCTNGIRAGLLLLGDGCYSLCTIQFLLRLVFPLCSMSIAISSVVLPYRAWGETDDVAVGLFKCCNFTEENSNSNISECSLLSDCFPSESNVYSLIKAAAGLQITYIVFHGITILLTTIIQLIRDSDERKRCQFYNGMVVFFAATICFISIIVSFSGVIQSHSLEGVPPRLSINLAIFSCAVYISYAGVCFREPRLCICVPISIAVNYLAIYMMTNKLVLKSVSVVGGLAIACLLIYLIFARPDLCRTNF